VKYGCSELGTSVPLEAGIEPKWLLTSLFKAYPLMAPAPETTMFFPI
jgi:hypothetical protein